MAEQITNQDGAQPKVDPSPDYLIKLLTRLVVSTQNKSSIPYIENAIKWVKQQGGASLKEFNDSQVAEAVEFLQRCNELEIEVDGRLINELDADLTLAIDEHRKLAKEYQTAVANHRVEGLEAIKASINVLTSRLTTTWLESEKAYRKLEQTLKKYHLPRIAERIEQEESISAASAKSKAERTPEYIRYKELLDSLFMLKSTASVISDKLQSFQKDVMQSVSTINRAIPNR